MPRYLWEYTQYNAVLLFLLGVTFVIGMGLGSFLWVTDGEWREPYIRRMKVAFGMRTILEIVTITSITICLSLNCVFCWREGFSLGVMEGRQREQEMQIVEKREEEKADDTIQKWTMRLQIAEAELRDVYKQLEKHKQRINALEVD